MTLWKLTAYRYISAFQILPYTLKESESVNHLVVSNSVIPRLLCPWDCHFLLRGSSWPRDWTCVSCIAGRFFTVWAIRETGFSASCGLSPKRCSASSQPHCCPVSLHSVLPDHLPLPSGTSPTLDLSVSNQSQFDFPWHESVPWSSASSFLWSFRNPFAWSRTSSP